VSFEHPSPVPPAKAGGTRRLRIAGAAALLLLAGAVLWVSPSEFTHGPRPGLQPNQLKSPQPETPPTNLLPTKAPFAAESFLTDFFLTEKTPVQVLAQFPAAIHEMPSIATGTYRQFLVGDPNQDRCHRITLDWKIARPFAFRLFDRLGRPVAFGARPSGHETVTVRASYYRIRLDYEGTIPRDASFTLAAAALAECPATVLGDAPAVPDIPRLDLTLPLSSAAKFDILRRHHEAALRNTGTSGQPIETRNQRVKGFLRFEQGADHSVVEIWAAGSGDIRHFSPGHPSYTVQIVSGPLVMGMAKFKLYSLPTKEGFLDFIASAMGAKEGLLIPRSKLIHLHTDGRDVGLYVMEEMVSAEFFEGRERYDSAVVSLGIRHHKPRRVPPGPNAGLSDNVDVTARQVDPRAFARFIAFLSRFNATHGLENNQLRFLVDPVTGVYEPIFRDINVNLWAENGLGVRSVLTHASWWLAPRFYGFGSHRNVKTENPRDGWTGCDLCVFYRLTPTTLGLGGTNPTLIEFMKDVRHRTLVEQALWYYSSPEYRSTLLRHLRAILIVALPHLGVELDKTLLHQGTNPFDPGDTSIGRLAIPLRDKGQLWLVPLERTPTTVRYALYNLSGFSLHLDPQARALAVLSPAERTALARQDYFLGPSSLFPYLINGLYEDRETDLSGRLSQRILRTALFTEFRLAASPEEIPIEAPYTPPFLVVQVPAPQEKTWLALVRAGTWLSVGGASPLGSDKIRLATELPLDAVPKYRPVRNREREDLELSPLERAVMVQEAGQFPIPGGYLLRYLVVNQSDQPVTLQWESGVGQLFPRTPSLALEPGTLFRLEEASVTGVSETGLIHGRGSLRLSPTARRPVTASTGLWIDNLVGLVNGPAEPGEPVLAVVDLVLIAQGTAKPTFRGYESKGYAQLDTAPTHVLALFGDGLPPGVGVRVHEPGRIPLWPHQGFPSEPREHRSPAPTFPTPKKSNGHVVLPGGTYRSLVVIGPDQTAIIPPGARLEFSEDGGLLVFGALEARGTAGHPIELLPLDRSWKGMMVINDGRRGRESRLEHVRIAGISAAGLDGRYQNGALTFAHARVVLRHVTVEDVQAEDAINLYECLFSIEDSLFRSMPSDGIDSDWGAGRIVRTHFEDCGGDCIDLAGTLALVEDNSMERAGDKCLSVGEGSVATLNRNAVSDCPVGVAVKDQSFAVGGGNRFRNNRDGAVVSYIKKPHFIAPTQRLTGSEFGGDTGNKPDSPRSELLLVQ